MALNTLILAAGQGTRMRSNLPKVLHRLAGKYLLQHCIETAATVQPQKNYVIVGHQAEKIQHALADFPITWVMQTEQLGTGHAVLQTLTHLNDQDSALILYGDVPLISSATLQQLITTTPKDSIGLITAHFQNPHGLGRIIRDAQKNILRIVEEKDATDQERTINEINSGIYLVPVRYLKKWLPQLRNHNSQKEYYLTDIITCALAEKIKIHSIQPHHPEEVFGINDRAQLAKLERFYQQQRAQELMLRGVTLIDPQRVDVRGELITGIDVTIDANTVFEGKVILGNECTIESNVIIRNAIIGDRVLIKANTYIDGAEIANDCVVGPFARIRPGTTLAEKVQLGNFVEIKNSMIGHSSKIHHLSYIGDTDMGKQVNIGAGTITCNYDGENKHRTIIEDSAFIGSNSSLVAPVTIGAQAVIGAGSTITENAPAHELTLGRAKQITIASWSRKKKEKNKGN